MGTAAQTPTSELETLAGHCEGASGGPSFAGSARGGDSADWRLSYGRGPPERGGAWSATYGQSAPPLPGVTGRVCRAPAREH